MKSTTKPGARVTIDDAVGRYIIEVIQHHANEKDETRAILRIATRLGRSRMVDEIGDGEIAALVAVRRGDQRRGGKWGRGKHKGKDYGLVSNRAVNADTKLLRALINRVELWGFQHGGRRQWARHILPEADERVAELTVEQEDRLWTALRNDRPDLMPMIRFALASGLRLANVIGLRWDQIDWDARIITYRAKSKKPGGAVKRLPITGEMMAILQGEKDRHAERVFTYARQKNGRGTSKGSCAPFTKGGWRRVWSRCLSDAGLPTFHFHDLRHTFATRMLRASGNLKATQRALGHSRIETTLRYAHTMDDDVRAAMEAGDSRQKIVGMPDGEKASG